MNLNADFGEIINKVRSKKPVIHIISNYVTAESVADMTLAAGGSPIMADEPEEMEEVVLGADALVINLGTINYNRMISMERAAAVAKDKGIPVVLDPVGVMSSSLRLEFAMKLLEQGFITIVRGNYSEIKAIVLEEVNGKGIKALETGAEAEGEALKMAQKGAAKYNCVFAVTGPVDSISDGKRAVVLNNGHPLLQDISGSGCMTSALVGTCAAVAEDMLVAAACGIVILGQGAELAANFLDKKDGPGMFKARLTDSVYHVTTKWNLVHLEPEQKLNK